MALEIQFKRNKNSTFNKSEYNTVFLNNGEPFFDASHNELYVGDGKTNLSSLKAINDAGEVVNKINNTENSLYINGGRISGVVANAIKSEQTEIANKLSRDAIKADDTVAENVVKFSIGEASYTKAIQGVYGPTGPIGPTGPMGIQGPTGPQGNIGPTGPQGAQGIQGLQGIPGIQGERGYTGPTGPTGPQGASGPTGSAGLHITNISSTSSAVAGAKNTVTISMSDGSEYQFQVSNGLLPLISHDVTVQTLSSGSAASAQVTGEGIETSPYKFEFKIPTGPQGSSGPTGPTGAVGPVATIEAGTTSTGDPGTDAQVSVIQQSGIYKLNFVIPRGNTGAMGPTGAQGIQGATGPTGATGPIGPTGPQGEQANHFKIYNSDTVDPAYVEAKDDGQIVVNPGINKTASINQQVAMPNCYGTQTPEEFFAALSVTPVQGQIYFKLLE